MSIEQVVNAVEIAANRLPHMDSLYKQAKDEVDKMQRTRQQLENYLPKLKEEIASSKELLKSYANSCERKRQETEHLNNDISRLETAIIRFKNNNEEYLNKIKHSAYEEVKGVLIDSKLLLKFATLSVIESLRMNSELYNFVIYDNSNNTTYVSSYHSLMLPGEEQQQGQSFRYLNALRYLYCCDIRRI